jgi:hypothetical protein
MLDVEKVQRVREEALKLRADPDDGKRWLADRLLLGFDIGDMNKALGLKADRSGPSPLRLDRNAARDDMIRQLALTYSGDQGQLVAQTRAALSDYKSRGWDRDNLRGEPFPLSPRRKLLFEIFKFNPNPPKSTSRLSEIIAPAIR